MIEKMKFLSITGPKEDFDRAVEQYLSRYEIHLENALSELKTVQNLRPFLEANPYKDTLAKADDYLRYLGDIRKLTITHMDADTANQVIAQIDSYILPLQVKQKELQEEIDRLRNLMLLINPFRELQFNLKTILSFQFISFRFGKIPADHYKRLENYVIDDLDSIFYQCHSDNEYVWGVYFVPKTINNKIDAIYSSLHFERIFLPDEYKGTPNEAYFQLKETINSLNQQITRLNQKILKKLTDSKEDLLKARCRLDILNNNFNIRKLAACTKDDEIVFYILCGWMTEKDAYEFTLEIENDENVYCIGDEDDEDEVIFHSPPTKLKNSFFIRPFELFTRMYGLPNYNEMDPTLLIALTYTFIFGAMFGDVGQGLLLVIGGFIIYKYKKSNLAAIISCSGIFSILFGFLYGSIFGFENIIDAIWLHPRTNTMLLPFIGEMNTVFVVTIAFGMILILLTMIFHIINAVKARDLPSLLFDANGITGLVFYGSCVLTVILIINKKPIPALAVLIIMFVIPLILIALKEPLTRFIEHKSSLLPDGKIMFLTQTFFEVFEILLSYFSNTISFIRIGAFAVSHAAMMEVVMILAGAEAGGSPNLLVIILGNLIVCALEGLIVGIQVLRLEYYEMFSRFYKGTGREFTPYKH